MKAHESITVSFWETVTQRQKQNPITQADYEEWRRHPCTLRMFEHFELVTLEAQTELAAMGPGGTDILTEQARVHELTTMIEQMYSWAPDGIKLEDEE